MPIFCCCCCYLNWCFNLSARCISLPWELKLFNDPHKTCSLCYTGSVHTIIFYYTEVSQTCNDIHLLLFSYWHFSTCTRDDKTFIWKSAPLGFFSAVFPNDHRLFKQNQAFLFTTIKENVGKILKNKTQQPCFWPFIDCFKAAWLVTLFCHSILMQSIMFWDIGIQLEPTGKKSKSWAEECGPVTVQSSHWAETLAWLLMNLRKLKFEHRSCSHYL